MVKLRLTVPLKVSFSYYQDRHTRNRSPIEHKPKIINSIEGPRLAVSPKMDLTSLNEAHFRHQIDADFSPSRDRKPVPPYFLGQNRKTYKRGKRQISK